MLLVYSLLQCCFKAMKIDWRELLVAALKKYSLKKMQLLSSFVWIFLTLSQQAVAQWSSNPAFNTPVSTASGGQFDPRMATDGAGGSIITWYDDRSGNPDIYAQRINAAGAVEWAANGVAICIAALDQVVPKIISDGAGGAIISWQDFRDGNSDIYAQRVNAAGIVQWAVNGVAISTAAGDQNFAGIISDGAGGAIISWQDSRSGNNDIYAQRINNAGAVEWATDGAAISVAAGGQSSLVIVSDGAGGAVITWEDARNGNSDIYAQRVNAAGDVQWAVNGVVITNPAGDQYDPVMISDNAGGAIITWEDARSGNNDVYAQLVNGSGNVQWAVDGLSICSAAGIQSNLAIASDLAGGAIITWEDGRSSNVNIYVQRINIAGSVLWAVDGVTVTTAANGQYLPKIISDGAGGAIVAWRDFRNGNDDDIYAQRVNNAGAVVWAANDVAICVAAEYQNEPEIVSNSTGGAIITWYDYRSGNADTYAQNVNADGSLGCSSPALNVQPQPQQAICKNATPADLKVTATGDGLSYQWYFDNDNQAFDGDPVSSETNPSFTPSTATSGTFYYYVIVTGTCGQVTSDYAVVTVNSSFTWYKDLDGDGFGNKNCPKNACYPPPGYVKNCLDCNDYDKTIYPGAPELCDFKDNDCDGKIDEYLTKKTYYKDGDCDGYGDPDKCVSACKCPSGYVTNNKDCDDDDKTIYPGAPELCDNKDNDCDGKTDEYLTKKSYYKDYDKDGYGDPKECKVSCTCPSGYVSNNKDCNDKDKTIYPGAPELCDNKDNDCDGKVDEYLTKKSYYKDYDKDGYGDPKECIVTCTCPSGYVINNKDCNDQNKKVNPGCKEIAGNKIDDNCNGKVDEKTSSARGINEEEIAYDEPANLLNIAHEVLKVKVLPNPSPNYFTLNMKGESDKPVQLRVVDISGRLVEVKNNVAANGTVTIGHSYRPGVYFVEVTQGTERVVVKCMKQ